jgi:CBS domain-containing protein
MIPIVENSGNMKLVGTITLRDIAKATAFNRNPQTTPAHEIMAPDPVTCRPEDDINRAFKLMEKCQIHSVPIVSADNKLLGMLSQDEMGLCSCTISKITMQ